MTSRAKRPREDAPAAPAAAPASEQAAASAPVAPAAAVEELSLAQAAAQSVGAEELLAAALPRTPDTLWCMMLENGTWLKNTMEKMVRLLPDVGIFTIDYCTETIDNGDGSSSEIAFYFLVLCQQLKDSQGILYFQYPIHYLQISEAYQRITDEVPRMAVRMNHLVNALKNSTTLMARSVDPRAPDARADDAGGNQARLVAVSLERGEDTMQSLLIRPLASDPFAKQAKPASNMVLTSHIPTYDIESLFEEYNRAHQAVDDKRSASQQFMCTFGVDEVQYRWSVLNLESAKMHHILTRAIPSASGSKEFAGASGAPAVESEVVARLRLFYMGAGAERTLVFNVQVFHSTTRAMCDVRFPTRVHTLSDKERADADKLMSRTVEESLKVREALVRAVQFIRVDSSELDDARLSAYKPARDEVLFDECYFARTLAQIFAQGGTETFALHFGYPAGV